MDKEKEVFDKWNIEKQCINNRNQDNVFIKTREIWYTKMGQNIGFEENGKNEFTRPVLVIKKVGNLFFTIALTTQGKISSPFYHKLSEIILYGNNERNINNSYAILSQARIMDKKRFEEKIGIISGTEFLIIKQKLTELLL